MKVLTDHYAVNVLKGDTLVIDGKPAWTAQRDAVHRGDAVEVEVQYHPDGGLGSRVFDQFHRLPGEIHRDTPTTDVEVKLSLTEFEASVVTGALQEYAEKWGAEGAHALVLRDLLRDQLPGSWKD